MRLIKTKFSITIFLLMSALSYGFQVSSLDRLIVAGNSFVNNEGTTFVFRGLNASDPNKLDSQGHWNKAYFEEIKNWGAKQFVKHFSRKIRGIKD